MQQRWDLVGLSIRKATPHRRLDAILATGNHVGHLIVWTFAAIFAGVVIAVLVP